MYCFSNRIVLTKHLNQVILMIIYTTITISNITSQKIEALHLSIN